MARLLCFSPGQDKYLGCSRHVTLKHKGVTSRLGRRGTASQTMLNAMRVSPGTAGLRICEGRQRGGGPLCECKEGRGVLQPWLEARFPCTCPRTLSLSLPSWASGGHHRKTWFPGRNAGRCLPGGRGPMSCRGEPAPSDNQRRASAGPFSCETFLRPHLEDFLNPEHAHSSDSQTGRPSAGGEGPRSCPRATWRSSQRQRKCEESN